MQKILNKLNKSAVKSLHNIVIQMRNNIIMSGIIIFQTDHSECLLMMSCRELPTLCVGCRRVLF